MNLTICRTRETIALSFLSFGGSESATLSKPVSLPAQMLGRYAAASFCRYLSFSCASLVHEPAPQMLLTRHTTPLRGLLDTHGCGMATSRRLAACTLCPKKETPIWLFATHLPTSCHMPCPVAAGDTCIHPSMIATPGSPSSRSRQTEISSRLDPRQHLEQHSQAHSEPWAHSSMPGHLRCRRPWW